MSHGLDRADLEARALAALAAIDEAEEARIQAGIAQDPDNPEMTEDDFRRLRPAAEVVPHVVAAYRASGGGRVAVRALRERLGMTRSAFAAAYRVPLNTLRDWEQNRSEPDAAARALLIAIAADPVRMRELLADAAE